MVRPSGCRGDADLGPVTDRTGRVEGRPVTASSRGEAGSSTQPPAVPFRSRPPLYPHQSHTPVLYEPYGFAHPPSHHTDTVYDPYLQAPTVMLGAARQDSSCSTHGYSHVDYGVSSSDHYVPRPIDRVSEGDRVFGEEQERVRTLHIQGESDERGDDDGDVMVTVVMMITMTVMMMEMRSNPYMLHLWHQPMDRMGVLITGKGRV
ncbi:hypothetical protein M9H77_31238 [Catharanthus roseus]|uniref:Uncharacterized protein n=1 Tax=Catharanthus roseus TaxID=4058 RepID=A0ACC0A0G8_CATRO|nr:hypothetical protein M9H77_31238 [Catharanthus roseus]